MVRIKVCGITSERDALEAVYLGVDALGFVFRRDSERYVEPDEAARIAARLPPLVGRIGVFADEGREAILETIRRVGLTGVELQGEEPPEECRGLPAGWYKAFRAGPGFRLQRLADYPCNTYLIHAPAPEKPGEESRRVDWDLALAAARYGRIILSGGLVPGNVAEAVRQARPYAVNVCGGVEIGPRLKDIEALERFVQAARRA